MKSVYSHKQRPKDLLHKCMISIRVSHSIRRPFKVINDSLVKDSDKKLDRCAIAIATVISAGLLTFVVAWGMLQYCYLTCRLMYGPNASDTIADCRTQRTKTSFINVPPVKMPLRHGRCASKESQSRKPTRPCPPVVHSSMEIPQNTSKYQVIAQ